MTATMTDLPRRRQFLVLGICCLSLLIVSMDSTIVNVALPSIRESLGTSRSGLQWTLDAYTLVLASLLILSGSVADRLGRRRVFQTGLVVFVAGSLLCSLAPSLGWLIGARMLQAVGGSMLNPVAMSIITTVFTDPRDRARAIGVWGGVVGLSIAVGPIVGGLLTETVGWRSIFWINAPIGVLAIILTARFVPESRAARARRIDPVGQVLVVVTLVTLVSAIIEGPRSGWTSLQVLGLFAVSAAALVGLLAYEPRRSDPLIELGFFASAPFSGATVIAVSAFAAFAGSLFLNTLYLQDVRGYSALGAGLCTLPMAVAAFVTSPLSGRLVAAGDARSSLVIAAACLIASTAALTQLSVSTPLVVLLASYFVFGIGFGMVNSPITNAAVSGMPRSAAGVAAAVASTSRQVGQSLGVAITGSLAGAASWVLVGAGGLVLAVGLATTSRWARGTAEAVGESMGEAHQPVAAR